MGHSSQRKTSSWATVGPADDKHQAPAIGLNLYANAVIETEAWTTGIKEETIAANRVYGLQSGTFA